MTRPLEVLAVALGFLLAPVMGQLPSDPAPSIDFGSLARAVQPDEVLTDPALERRARALSAGLRCLVCQNQSIDDSDAALAKDLRVLVRERLEAGDDDRAVLDYVVARYGEFVLLKPRLSLETILLWGTPLLILGGGAAFAIASARRRANETRVAELTPDEEIAVDRALKERGF